MPFYWTELNTRRIAEAKEFYAATFGWTFRRIEGDADYWLVSHNDEIVGGFYGMDGNDFDDIPSHWFSYVEVQDVDLACRTAVAAGGSILRDPMVIPDVGRIAILRDPDGSPIGCISPHRAIMGLTHAAA